MKKIVPKVIALVVCTMLIALSVGGKCLAFELFEEKGVMTNYKWGNKNSSYDFYLKCNGSLLTGQHAANQYSNAFNKWNNISSNVHAINIDYDNSNVKFVTVQVESYWNAITGAESETCGGITFPYDKNGDLITSSNTNTDIKSVVIYINPKDKYGHPDLVNYDKFEQQEEYARKTLIHELGHALGLGHPVGKSILEAYIMNSDYTTRSVFAAPTANDKVELRKKYGN